MTTKETRTKEAIAECKTCKFNATVHIRNVKGKCKGKRPIK